MRHPSSFFIFVLLLFSCTRKDAILPNPGNSLRRACLPSLSNKNPTRDSPYQRLTFSDEFNGPEPGDDPTCFSRKPNCRNDLGNFKTGTCPSDMDVSGFSLLNKCNWSLWAGVSAWDTTHSTSYHPNQVHVVDGKLILSAHFIPQFKSGTCLSPPSPLSGRSCPVEMGGLDSGPGLPVSRGRDFQDGRFEVRVRLPSQQGSSPSVWSWPILLQEGYPFSRLSWEGYRIGEFDFFETKTKSNTAPQIFMSYHDWGPPSNKTAQSSSDLFSLPTDRWIRIGIERMAPVPGGAPRKALWYVNDGDVSCYIKEVVEGDSGMSLSNWPEFLIMNFQAENTTGPISTVDGARFEVDFVRFYSDIK